MHGKSVPAVQSGLWIALPAVHFIYIYIYIVFFQPINRCIAKFPVCYNQGLQTRHVLTSSCKSPTVCKTLFFFCFTCQLR
jgi:hypothetical protein